MVDCSRDCLNCNLPDCLCDEPPHCDLDSYALTDDVAFEAWLEKHKVKPLVPADWDILFHAYKENFEGRKLSKALYKVNHREKYLKSKKEWKRRYKARKRLSKALE